jgi:hypothetical protein
MAFLCVSQQGEVKNTIKTFWEKYMSKKNYKKDEENKIVFIFSA